MMWVASGVELRHDLLRALPDHALDHGRIDVDRWAVRTHAPGVEPGVAIAGTLVVARRRHRYHVLAVHETHHADLRALHPLLEDDRGAGVAKRVSRHRGIDRVDRLRRRFGNHH